MRDKFEIVERELQARISVPIGDARVRPLYKRFLRAKDSGEIPRSMTWAAYQIKHPDLVYAAEWQGARTA